jgi:hypothetical protein
MPPALAFQALSYGLAGILALAVFCELVATNEIVPLHHHVAHGAVVVANSVATLSVQQMKDHVLVSDGWVYPNRKDAGTSWGHVLRFQMERPLQTGLSLKRDTNRVPGGVELLIAAHQGQRA